MEVNPITYKDFSYGWVQDSVEKDPDNIPDNGLEQADNVDINGQGGISKRHGSGPLNAVSYGANCKQVEEWIKSDSSVQLFGVVGTDFCKFAEDGTKTVVQALNANANKVWWVPTITGGADKLFFGDSFNYYVWDGTTCHEVYSSDLYTLLDEARTKYIAHCAMGTGTHKTADTVNNNPTAIASEYLTDVMLSANNLKTKYNAHDADSSVYHNAAGVAHQISAANATNAASLLILLQAIKTAYEAHRIATDIHTAGDSTNNIMASVLADLTLIRTAIKVVWHSKSHRYMAISKGMNCIAYSEEDDPTDFRPSSILFPTQAEGEPIGIEEFGDSIVVRYTFGAYIWRGYDPSEDVVWEPIPLKVGGFNPWDSTIIPGALFYPGAGGIYTPGMSLLGTNVTAEASGDLVPNLAQGRVSTLIDDIFNKDIICTIDDGSKTYMAYNDTPGATTNSKVLVWHRLNGGGFTRYLGWNVNHWCLRKNGDLLFATDNYIMKAKQPEYNDNGLPIHFIAKTKWFSLGFLGLLKKLFKTTIISQQNQTKSTIDMTVNSDTVVTGVTETGISLNSGFIWGMVYGPPWGGMRIITRIIKTIIKGMRFQVTLQNNVLNEAVDLYGLAFKFRVGKPGGEKVD